MSDTGNISQSIIEAGARAEYERDMTAEESDDFEPFTWDEALTRVKDLYRERFKAGLAAAFAECEVREEFGHTLDETTASEARSRQTWHAWQCPDSVQRRIVITTPPVVVTPAQEETAE